MGVAQTAGAGALGARGYAASTVADVRDRLPARDARPIDHRGNHCSTAPTGGVPCRGWGMLGAAPPPPPPPPPPHYDFTAREAVLLG